MSLTVRPAAEADALVVASIYEESCQYLRGLGDPAEFRFSVEAYWRDGFGPNPAFCGLIAELNDEVIGYLLYHFGYDVDLAARTMHIIDLFVRAGHRRHGAGRALMMHARDLCRRNNVGQMIWSVYKPNQLAYEFYRGIGARLSDDMDTMQLEIEA